MNNSIIQVSQHFCRLCSHKSSFYFSLFDNKASEMLESLTSIKVNLHEQASSSVCPRCLIELREAYTIQQKLIQSERLLIEQLNELTNGIQKPPEMNCIQEAIFIVSNENPETVSKPPEEMSSTLSAPLPEKLPYTSVPTQTTKLNISDNPDLHIINVDYKCSKCPETFSNTTDFLTHIDLHRTKLCCYCGKHIHVDKLQEHRKEHSSGVCEFCGRTLSNKQALLMHVLNHHSQPKVMCELCGVVSVNSRAHEQHVRKMHTKEPSHVCDICGAKLFAGSALKQHIQIIHERKLPFGCGVCKKKYPSQDKLRFHMRKHSDEKLFVCEFCGKGFNFDCNLRTHQKTMHGCVEVENFRCDVCKKGFSTVRALDIHTRMHRK